MRTIGPCRPQTHDVRTRQDPPIELLQLADLQAGVLSREQTTGYGLSRYPVDRLVDEGHWQRLSTGLLYTRRESPPWLALAWGGVLLGGQQARLGGLAAGHLHGLVPDPPTSICVHVPYGVQMLARGPWVFRRERPGLRWPSTGSPSRIRAADAVLDLCDEATEDRVIDLVTRAVQARRVAVVDLRRRVGERPRVRHRALLLALLADVAQGAETPLELAYLRQVERPHGLPKGHRQQRNRAGHLRDVRYDEYQTVVELDGRLGHEGVGRFRDMQRDNYATVSGEATLRYGHVDVWGRSCLVAWQVGSVLMNRGWPGAPTRCGRCQRVTSFA